MVVLLMMGIGIGIVMSAVICRLLHQKWILWQVKPEEWITRAALTAGSGAFFFFLPVQFGLLEIFVLTVTLGLMAWIGLNDYQTHMIRNRSVMWIVVLFLARVFCWLFLGDGFYLLLSLTEAFLGMLYCSFLFLLVYAFSRKAVGGGDVKLFIALGLYLGLQRVNTMLIGTMILLAIVSGFLILTKKATWKSSVPLGPFAFIGFWLAVMF